MSEVEKFKCIGYMVGRSRLGGAEYVFLSDFDRLTAERDAERRRADVAVADANAADAAGNKVSELLSNRTAERDALQALLTAADERADQAVTIIGKWKEIFGESMARRSEIYVMTDAFLAELKPAEPTKNEHVCSGCGSKGWTANCKECVPY